METIWIRDPGWKKVGSGKNIPDPQHWLLPVSVGDSGHFGTDPAPRIRASVPWIWIPAIFVLDLQDANKKSFSVYYFLKVHLHHFLRQKVVKKSPNRGNQRFYYYFA
jgi:hypothetical protein